MTARQDLRAVAKEKARHPAALPNVLLGGQVAVRVGIFFFLGGLKPPRVFLSKVSAAGQRGGYGVWGVGGVGGLGMACFVGTDSSAPH